MGIWKRPCSQCQQVPDDKARVTAAGRFFGHTDCYPVWKELQPKTENHHRRDEGYAYQQK